MESRYTEEMLSGMEKGTIIRLFLAQQEQPENIFNRPWMISLLEHGKLTELDRTTMAETVKEILVFEDGHIEITYLFSDELGILDEPGQDG